MSVWNGSGFQESQNKDLSPGGQITMISGLSPRLPEDDNSQRKFSDNVKKEQLMKRTVSESAKLKSDVVLSLINLFSVFCNSSCGNTVLCCVTNVRYPVRYIF